MTPIDNQDRSSKVSVEGQAYSLYVGEGGISILQTSIFWNWVETFYDAESKYWSLIKVLRKNDFLISDIFKLSLFGLLHFKGVFSSYSEKKTFEAKLSWHKREDQNCK